MCQTEIKSKKWLCKQSHESYNLLPSTIHWIILVVRIAVPCFKRHLRSQRSRCGLRRALPPEILFTILFIGLNNIVQCFTVLLL